MRAARGLSIRLEAFLHDLRFAFRGLWRDWPFSVTAVAMLVVAIALNVTVSMIVNTLLFRGSPLVKENDRLVYIQEAYPSGTCCISYYDVNAWRSEARSLEGVGYMGELAVTMRRDDGRSFDTTAGVISTNTFGLLQVRPTLGRDFVPTDEAAGASPVAILSHRFWETEFGKRSDIVGATVRIDGVPTSIVGVMPQGFAFPVQEDFWIPVRDTPQMRQRGATFGGFIAFGRMRPGARAETVRAELDAINRRLGETYPDSNRGVTPSVRTYSQLFVGSNARNVFTAVWVGAWFVLLIACVNVANLTLVRTTARWGEASTRIALGAPIGRLVRQVLMESLMLAIVAATIGWWIATWGLRRWAAVTASRYQILDYSVDSSALTYLAGIAVLATTVCSLAPIGRIVRLGLTGAVKDEARGTTQGLRSRRVTAMLVAGQMALAMVLFSGTGVLGRSFLSILYANTGVRNPEQVLSAAINLPADRYLVPATRLAFFERLEAQLSGVPGVAEQSVASTLPVDGVSRQLFEIEGRAVPPEGHESVQMVGVGPGYFHLLGASMSQGREFNGADRFGALPVAVVNQSFIDRFGRGGQLLGVRIRAVGSHGEPGVWRTVIGVASNIMQGDGTRQSFQPVFYIPVRQNPPTRTFVMLRTTRPPDQVIRSTIAQIQQLDPQVSVRSFATLNDHFGFDRDRMDGEHSELGKYVTIAPVMTAIALPLAALGLIAVVSHSVSQRTKEIGVRLAIGATAKDVRHMVVTEGMMPVVAGVFVGLAASFGVNRALQSQLVGVSPHDPVTLAAATVVLIAVALAACVLPVRSALRVDPAIALRYD